MLASWHPFDYYSVASLLAAFLGQIHLLINCKHVTVTYHDAIYTYQALGFCLYHSIKSLYCCHLPSITTKGNLASLICNPNCKESDS